MSNKSREKELARAAAKREEEKKAARRKKSLIKGAAAFAITVAVVLAGFAFFGGKDEKAAPGASATPTASAADAPCDFTPPADLSEKEPPGAVPDMTVEADGSYRATISTSCGDIEVELLPDQAPVAVNSFIALAEDGWYDDTIFHRIAASIDIIQAGDPTCVSGSPQCGSGGPGYSFDDELTGDEKYTTGTVAMANSGPNTNGSQFFIVTGPNAAMLPPSYTIFGELVGKDSLKVAQKIQSLPLQVREGAPEGSEPDQPVDQIWIRSVKIDAKPR